MEFQELLDLRERIRASPENKILRDIEFAQWSFYVFQGNCTDLKNLLNRAEIRPNAIELWEIQGNSNINALYREISRRLHNLVSSAMTLVDHTRRHVKQLYVDHPFLVEYENEVSKNFSSQSWHPIVQGLRNYTLHRALPEVMSEISVDMKKGGETNLVFYLPVDVLLEWNGWGQTNKTLETLDKGQLPIRPMAEEYESTAVSFYKWLWEHQKEVHREDLERLNHMIYEYNEAVKTSGYGEESTTNTDISLE